MASIKKLKSATIIINLGEDLEVTDVALKADVRHKTDEALRHSVAFREEVPSLPNPVKGWITSMLARARTENNVD